MSHSKVVSRIRPTPTTERPLEAELVRRMRGPQRYRLLQGYPMPPLMKTVTLPFQTEPVKPDLGRKLIVGVLPHASCAPSVKGCGYCTFPHQSFRRSSVVQTVERVIQEVGATPHSGRRVEALYFGGGTANLTPPESFEKLLEKVEKTFDLERAEITLEGAPAFFLSHGQELLRQLQTGVIAESKRLSMGVQTFSEPWLEKMGRMSLGNPRQMEAAVGAAHDRAMTISADLMINLPGQGLPDMLADVERASDLGFDQICLYHLVLFRGIGTAWSRDTDMLKALPDNETAYENWLRVTDRARELGYVQKTVTNFERSGNYRYENDSFQPEAFDAVGFGPAAISGYTDLTTQTGVKWINKTSNEQYRAAIDEGGDARDKVFMYGNTDLKLLYLTRTLAGLSSSRNGYRTHYGSDPVDDFADEFEALERAGLVSVSPSTLSLTRRGNFFADSVTGLLARRRVSQLRNSLDDPNSSGKIHMG